MLSTDLEVLGHVLGEDVHHPQPLVKAFRRLGTERGGVRAGARDEHSFFPGQTEPSTRGLLDARRLLGRDALLLSGNRQLCEPDQLRNAKRRPHGYRSIVGGCGR